MQNTQEQLAELCGISVSYMGHIDRGSRKMSLETLVSLCESLNVSSDIKALAEIINKI